MVHIKWDTDTICGFRATEVVQRISENFWRMSKRCSVACLLNSAVFFNLFVAAEPYASYKILTNISQIGDCSFCYHLDPVLTLHARTLLLCLQVAG